MRGTRVIKITNESIGGIIPAYAGNTDVLFAVDVLDWDHPRVCGEHYTYDSADITGMGSSPRMRGTPRSCGMTCGNSGIIPAYAGNTLRD